MKSLVSLLSALCAAVLAGPAIAAEGGGAGHTATQAPASNPQAGKKEAAAPADAVDTPGTPELRWTDVDITASRILHLDPSTLPDKRVLDANPLNPFLEVEEDGYQVSVFDGDTFEPIYRFQSRFALYSAPICDEGGRYAFFSSRGGWITKFDLWNRTLVAEIRAGIDTSNLAVSPEGRHVAVANRLPRTLVVLDGELNLLKSIDVGDRDGKMSSRVSAVYDATPRRSFIAALKDVPEVWEISYTKAIEDIPVGFIHDFKQREGAFIPGYLNPRRTVLDEALDDFLFTPDYSEVIGVSRDGTGRVVNLDVRKKVADVARDGMPAIVPGIKWKSTDARGRARSVTASAGRKACGSVTVREGTGQRLVLPARLPR